MKFKLILVIALFFSLQCWANVPIKLQITGVQQNVSLTRPYNVYTATLTGATPTGEYDWSVVTGGAEMINSSGNYSTLNFTSAPSLNEPLTVRIVCTAYYMEDNKRKSENAHLDVSWACPLAVCSIEGNTEVLDDFEETYTAYFQVQNYSATPIFEWRVGNPEGTETEGNPFTTSFEGKGGQTVSLYKKAHRAGGSQGSAGSLLFCTIVRKDNRWIYVIYCFCRN